MLSNIKDLSKINYAYARRLCLKKGYYLSCNVLNGITSYYLTNNNLDYIDKRSGGYKTIAEALKACYNINEEERN